MRVMLWAGYRCHPCHSVRSPRRPYRMKLRMSGYKAIGSSMSEGTRRKRLHRSGVIAYLLERQSDMRFPFALPFELRLNLIVPISLHGEPVRCYVAEKSSAWSDHCAALAVFPNRVYLATRLQPGPFVWHPHRGASITSAPASHKAFLRWRTPQMPLTNMAPTSPHYQHMSDQVAQSIVYKRVGELELHLDVIYPRGARDLPVVLWFHIGM